MSFALKTLEGYYPIHFHIKVLCKIVPLVTLWFVLSFSTNINLLERWWNKMVFMNHIDNILFRIQSSTSTITSTWCICNRYKWSWTYDTHSLSKRKSGKLVRTLREKINNCASELVTINEMGVKEEVVYLKS